MRRVRRRWASASEVEKSGETEIREKGLPLSHLLRATMKCSDRPLATRTNGDQTKLAMYFDFWRVKSWQCRVHATRDAAAAFTGHETIRGPVAVREARQCRNVKKIEGTRHRSVSRNSGSRRPSRSCSQPSHGCHATNLSSTLDWALAFPHALILRRAIRSFPSTPRRLVVLSHISSEIRRENV